MKKIYKIILIIWLLLLVFAIFPKGIFVPEARATKILEEQGYSSINITRKDIWFIPLKGGDQMDVVRFTASALNPVNKPVTVYVFVGWPFKGTTVRGL